MTSQSINYLVGIDEVGRGPLAGPVTVAAFAVRKFHIKKVLKYNLKNSKALSASQREKYAREFAKMKKDGVASYAVTSVSEKIIDKKGITYSIHLAIARSIQKLNLEPTQTKVLLDGGIKAPPEYLYQKTIVRGDEKEPIIAAASIVAKVARDILMARLSKKFPQYGFEQHKGYGTKQHYHALKKHGPSKVHRSSFLRDVR